MEATRSPQPVRGPEQTSTPEVAPSRVGRCPTCAAFTYDARGLTEEELRRLVLDTEGRVLTRLVTRADGRVMPFDCGHGTVGSRARAPWTWLVGLAVLLGLGAALGWRAFATPAPPPITLDGPQQVPEVVRAPPAPVEQAPALAPEVQVDGVRVPPPAEPPAVVDLPRAPALPARVDVHLADVVSSWSAVVNGKARATPAEVAQSLEQQLEPLRACYREVLSVDASYRGTLSSTVFVDAAGQVSSVSIPLIKNRVAHEGLKDCCEAALKRLQFPTRWGAGSVTCRLVFAGGL